MQLGVTIPGAFVLEQSLAVVALERHVLDMALEKELSEWKKNPIRSHPVKGNAIDQIERREC
jgi:hypothetical protein